MLTNDSGFLTALTTEGKIDEQTEYLSSIGNSFNVKAAIADSRSIKAE